MDSFEFMGIYGTLTVLVLTLIWIFVPFAIFGIKTLLRESIAEQRKTNELLAQLVAVINR